MLRRLCLLTCCTLGFVGFALAADPPAKWEMDSLLRTVQPMTHPLKGRLPLLLWNSPLPRDKKLVALRADGTLRTYIDALAARGIVPPVEMGWEWDPDAAMAMALTLKEAGQPVHVLAAFGIVGGEDELYANTPKVTGKWPLNEKGELTWTGTRAWPILPVYDVSKSVAFYTEWMHRFKDAGIDVKAVWTDYEGLPYPWNFVYDSQKAEAARKHYPDGALDSFPAFAGYIAEVHNTMLSEAIADPVHAVFPKALVGNYGAEASTEAFPFVDTNGAPYGIFTLGRLDVAMPSIYANTAYLPRYYNLDWEVTAADVDNVYFTTMVRSMSAALAGTLPGKLSMPYVSRFTPDKNDPRYLFPMSRGYYRELLRHGILRGADGYYLFNLGYNPQGAVTPQLSFDSVEDARAVTDELLAYREFLEKGTPMTFDVPALRTPAVIWSGLKLKDRCLVRVWTLGTQPRTLDLVAFGKGHVLKVPTDGATYLIDKNGKVKTVKTGLL